MNNKKLVTSKEVASQNWGRPNKHTAHLELRLGIVTRVDEENFLIDVKWETAMGGSLGVEPNIPMTSMGWSPRSFMGMMPEIGSGIVAGYIRTGADVFTPFPLAYIPRATLAAKNFNPTQVYFGNDMQEGEERIRARLRKIYPGEALIQSSQGAEILVDKDLLLSNQRANEIILRSSDQTIIQRALNHFLYGDGVAIKTGLVVRNDLTTPDDKENTEFKQSQEPMSRPFVVLPDGRRHTVVTKNGTSIDDGGQPLTEWRIDLRETGDGVMDVVRDIDGATVDSPASDALVTVALGNVVGNNPDDQPSYGQVLAPTLSGGVMKMEAVGEDRFAESAAFYLKAGAFQYAVAKSGNVFADYPGDINSNFQKGLNLALGSNPNGESLNIAGKGGLFFKSGKEALKDGRPGRGFGIDTTGSMEVRVSGATPEGYALDEYYRGHVITRIDGDWIVKTKGAVIYEASGGVKEKFKGQRKELVMQDKIIYVGGKTSYTHVDAAENIYGTGHEVTIALPKTGGTTAQKTTIVLGDKEINLTLGSYKTSLKLGNIEQTTLVGNITHATKLGNVEVSTAAGNVTVSTMLGNVEMSTLVGLASVKSSLAATLESQLMSQVKAPIVMLGASTVVGGVVTGLPVPSHFDYVVGLPLKGSLSVFATS